MIRLLIVPVPQIDCEELGVPFKSTMVIRMDIHPRLNCVIAPGASLSSESIRSRLQLEPGDPVSIGVFTGGEDIYYQFETNIGKDHG